MNPGIKSNSVCNKNTNANLKLVGDILYRQGNWYFEKLTLSLLRKVKNP
jgi:hypothetical protein